MPHHQTIQDIRSASGVVPNGAQLRIEHDGEKITALYLILSNFVQLRFPEPTRSEVRVRNERLRWARYDHEHTMPGSGSTEKLVQHIEVARSRSVDDRFYGFDLVRRISGPGTVDEHGAGTWAGNDPGSTLGGDDEGQ